MSILAHRASLARLSIFTLDHSVGLLEKTLVPPTVNLINLIRQVDDGLVCIRMTPDEEGRFGFNVKGGSDLAMPILVSRVAPNTPADRCYPKLNEGDQVRILSCYYLVVEVYHVMAEVPKQS